MLFSGVKLLNKLELISYLMYMCSKYKHQQRGLLKSLEGFTLRFYGNLYKRYAGL